MLRATKKIFLLSFLFCSLAAVPHTFAQGQGGVDDSEEEEVDPDKELPYPISDRQVDFFTNDEESVMDLEDPENIRQEVEYDPETRSFIIREKIGNQDYRRPISVSYEEFMRLENEKSVENYFEERSKAVDLAERRSGNPELYVGPELENRLFGSPKIEIKPRGNVDVTVGLNSQKIDNPTLRESQRKQTNFDFDMNIQMNVTGQIGDKMKLNTNFNTKTTFNFENQIKLAYKGKEDDIIQILEAGNVSLPLRGTLIRGNQSLFGLKTQLKFGRLTITNILSQQKSQAENIRVENGAQTRKFDIKADQYESDKHFFLNHFFRDTYENNLKNLPVINTPAVINRIEVWVTNKTRQTQNIREVVAFMDLGETDQLFNQTWNKPTGGNFPDNNANNLYRTITQGNNQDQLRDPSRVISFLENDLNMSPIDEFEKTGARKLSPSEYVFNERLGYISLNQTLRPNEVLGVAVEYVVNGQVYRIGEFSDELPPGGDTTTVRDRVLVLKLLKSTSIRTNLPIWDLMMKNVYSLNAFQVNKEDFFFDVYYNDPGGGQKRYLPEGGDVSGTQLLRVLGMDRLNNQLDPQPDGRFDFIEGITINSRNGRIIFPVLEPFGSSLKTAINDDAIGDRYAYQLLYDTTLVAAQQFPEFNRFSLRGSYKSNVSNEINLNAFNIPRGSVTVTAGGRTLQENIHYTINYGLGKVQIIDEGIVNSGVPIDVRFENNSLFGIRNKSLIGTRFDYWISDNFTLGATHMRLSERPFTQKVNIGDDPIKNNIYGFDFNYETTSETLTRALSKVSFSESKSPSKIAVSGEMARFKPGHSKAVDLENQGTVYVDDFEGSSINFDLKFPFIAWKLASTPKGIVDRFGTEQFPESRLADSLTYGYNRAKLAWYQVDGTFYNSNNASNNPLIDNRAEQEGLYSRLYFQRQIFPNRDNANLQNPPLFTFDMSFFPEERGPYNFDESGIPGISAGTAADGKLLDPASRWGGIMRNIETNNFEAANIEFIQFWVLDPFLERDQEGRPKKGELLIHLGTVSEDVLKDSRRMYENGLPRPGGLTSVDTSNWGVTPSITNAITNSFDSDPDVVITQDVGMDGLDDDSERNHYRRFLNNISAIVNNQALAELEGDPAQDNYVWALDVDRFANSDGIVTRYKNFNGTQGNSSYNLDNGQNNLNGNSTNTPDNEDLNEDNTLNETEEYFQYRVDFSPEGLESSPFVQDRVVVPVVVDGVQDSAIWYQMKIPLESYDQRVGNIQDFRSIQYLRLVMTEFERPAVLRFAEFGLLRNQWRRYLQSLQESREQLGSDAGAITDFNVSAVSVEENTGRSPIPYAIPPGITRETTINGVNNTFQNEQALSLQVCELEDGDARAIYKLPNLDLRRFKRIKLFAHAENLNTDRGELLPIEDDEINLFVRIGADFKENFYEYEIPLKVTRGGAYNPNNDNDRLAIWPDANDINLFIDSLTTIKQLRNNQKFSPAAPFYFDAGKGRRYTVRGNPDLGQAQVLMIGIRNPKRIIGVNDDRDDGQSKCAEVWINELRLSGFDERGGWAALGRVDVQLGDIGNVTLSGNMHTIGFGDLEQKLDDRYLDNYYQYDISTNLELGKFIPQKAGIQIPLYANYSQAISTPQYDPYELDIEVKDKLAAVDGDPDITFEQKEQLKKDIKEAAQDVTTIKGVNITNMRKIRTNPEKKPRVYDIENFDFTYAYTEIERNNPIIEEEKIKRHKGSVGYNHSTRPKYIQPLKNIRSNHGYLKPFKEFNFNPFPSSISFRTDLDRQFGQSKIRDIGDDGLVIAPTYDKYFTWDRFYTYKHDITKSIKFDYSATANTRVDEPPGVLDTPEKKDSLKQNFFDGGRKINYEQRMNASYTVPLKYIPILDWITARARYGSTYNWTAGSLIVPELGNVMSNKQDIQLNGEFNFKNLYNKIPALKPYNDSKKRYNKEEYKKSKDRSTNAKNRIIEKIAKKREEFENKTKELAEAKKDTSMVRDDIKQLKKDKSNIKNDLRKLKGDKKKQQPHANPAINALVSPILGIKRASVNYTISRATTLPGFMPSPNLFGQDFGAGAPGFGFLFGAQKDTTWLPEIADKGWLTTDTTFNYQFQQSHSRDLSVRMTVEPWRDLRIDINLDRKMSQTYSEFYKKPTANSDFQHFTPNTNGSYSVSFIMLKTLFQDIDQNNFSTAFRDFETLRAEYSSRFAELNPNSTGEYSLADSVVLNGFREGYGPYSQDVLIPAFLAAYTGRNPSKVRLNPLNTIPLPNWRLTYNGFTKMKWGKKVFKSFKIDHGYSSTFSVSSYSSDLNFLGTPGFNEDDVYFVPRSIDSLSGNYYNLYNIPQITVSEQLQPLIGVDITWINGLITTLEFKKSRQLGLSFLDFQLSENKSTEITAGLGYTLKGLTLPFKMKGKKVTLENDINFRCDFSLRDDRTVNYKLDQNIAEPTRGSKTITLSPTIDYVINNKLNIRLFYDFRKTIPATLSSYPTRTARGGVTIRFNLEPDINFGANRDRKGG